MARMLSRWVGVALVLLLAGAASASSQADRITLVVTEYDSVNSSWPELTMRFAGVVNGAGAGEVVDVVGRDCGAKSGDIRLIVQTRTRDGGGYQVDNPEQVSPFRWVPVQSGIELRSRWNGQFSDPYVWKQAAPFYVGVRTGKRRVWTVHFAPRETFLVNMKGRIVELQRQIGARWVRYARARLAYKPHLQYGAFNYEAKFAVPKRGLKLRAVLPAASAAPCYLKTVTPPWRT
jgi:hypothetical protein